MKCLKNDQTFDTQSLSATLNPQLNLEFKDNFRGTERASHELEKNAHFFYETMIRTWSQRLRFITLAFLGLSLIARFTPSAQAQARFTCTESIQGLLPFAYPDELRHLHPGVKHTIQDMPRFLREKLGAELLEGVKDPRSTYVVVQGPANERALSIFPQDQIQSIHEIHNPFGAFNAVKVKTKDGVAHYVLTNVNGRSRLIQVLSLLKLAGVNAERLHVVGRSRSYKSIYKKTFAKLSHTPDLVVFGFANTALEALFERLPRDKALAFMRANQAYSERKWVKPKFNEHELSHLGVQVIETQNGKRIWYVDNEYGDRAAWLFSALKEQGAKRFVILGTAGSLDHRYPIGNLVSPEYLIKPNGQKMKSPFISVIQKSGSHGDVEAPSIETVEWVQQEASKGVQYIDVELQKIVPLVESNDEVSAYFVISDEINIANPKDYTQWTDHDRQRSKIKILEVLDAHMKEIGIDRSTPIKNYKIELFDTES